MKRGVAASAKVARPIVRGAVARTRLFEKLDQLREWRVIWVCGPAGCGKTTLVSMYLDARGLPALWYQVDPGDADPATFFYYLGQVAQHAAPRHRKPLPLLTPEYLPGLATFAGRYFESLCGRLRAPAALVFDNLQEAEEAQSFYELLQHGLARMPPGLNVFLISRYDLPAAFARMLANRDMAVVGWEELRLAPDEATEIIRLRAPDGLSREVRLRLHEAADGWAAGLVLLLEWVRREGVAPDALPRATPNQVLDYFWAEVFRKLDPAMQEFLLKTAWLPRMTARTAEALTGLPSAGTILARLSSQNTFTERRLLQEPVYRYHPLMREALLARGRRVFEPEELAALRRRAAALLEEEGETEAAVTLLQESGDWEALTALILKHAPSLLAQGRHRVLEGWLKQLPAKVLTDSPWLEYWKGITVLPFDPSAARRVLERAFEEFKGNGDAAGTFLAWAGTVDAILYEQADFAALDRWIGELDEYCRTQTEFPSPAIEARVAASMVTALAFRQPWRSDLETWASRALSIQAPEALGAQVQVWWVLAYHSTHMGEFSKATVAVDHLRRMARSPDAPPLGRLTALAAETGYSLVAGDHEGTQKAALAGLEAARREGIHLHDQMLLGQAAASDLDVGDWRQARGRLEQMGPLLATQPPFVASLYHLLRTREALVRGDAREALAHSDLMLQTVLACGVAINPGLGFVLKARVLHALRQDGEAAECLTRAHENAKTTASRLIQFYALMLEAEVGLDRGQRSHGLEVLRRALRLGSEGGYLNTFVDVPAATARLCATALEAGIEVPYVQWLIRKRHLVLEEPPYQLASWPWPLRVHTLGGFRLEKDGTLLSFTGKVKQKPLLLLKALIAMGGAEVREEHLSDLLWPDADGDAAHSDFTTTLSRLRDMLGLEKAIRVQEGRVTLDPQVCWVDAWAFERMLGEIERRFRDGRGENTPAGHPTLPELFDRTMSLYPGHFLPADEAHVWTASYRERLRDKFLRLITRWGEHLERAEDWGAAVECYQRGLEVDELAETFYQHLMTCYQRLGLRAEALATYARCKTVLSSRLGVAPSPKTEGLARALRG